MGELSEQTSRLQHCLDRFQAGDRAARDELINCACGQLTRLTRKLLRDYPGVHRWEQTDDVLQNAALRLWKSLLDVTPRSLAEFFGLAALHVRRELIDLARTLYGPQGYGAHHASDGPDQGSQATPPDPGNTTNEPSRLAAWTEFHRQVEALPPEERAAFDLLWYQGLTHPEAAALLGISERTLRRRWRLARVRVRRALKGSPLASWAGADEED